MSEHTPDERHEDATQENVPPIVILPPTNPDAKDGSRAALIEALAQLVASQAVEDVPDSKRGRKE